MRVERHLGMPCCPAQAVLKTSSLGTRFFAHKAKGGCSWKPETEVHLHLTALALKTAREAGWEAETEASGAAPDGECWTADVLAWKGEARIALEIQWSGQTVEETWRRQLRYHRSGVQGVWLLRQPGFPLSSDLPAACIGGSAKEGLTVLVSKSEDTRAQQRKESASWLQTFDPQAFLSALFEGRFRFGITHVDELTLNIETGVLACWDCGAPTRIVTWLADRAGPHAIRETLELADGAPELLDHIQRALAHRNDIGEIRRRYSKTVQGSYVSNGCAHCGALIGRFFEHNAWYCEEETVATVTWTLNTEEKRRLKSDTQRWAVLGGGANPQTHHLGGIPTLET